MNTVLYNDSNSDATQKVIAPRPWSQSYPQMFGIFICPIMANISSMSMRLTV